MMSKRARSTQRTRPISPSAGRRVVCEIRILSTEAELIESYRLRHEVYGALGYLRCDNRTRLEIDEFDASSTAFGAFDPVSAVMIGTLRLITSDLQPEHHSLIQRVVGSLDDPDLTDQALGPRIHLLPSITSDEIARQIAAFNTGRFPVRELSRTIVHPGHRGGGVSRGLVEVGLAHASRSGPAVLVGSCLPEHVPMYAKYGYSQLRPTGLDYFASVGRFANLVICRTDVLPQPTRDHVDDLLHSVRSGVVAHVLEVDRTSRAPYRFTPSHRVRRRTMEW
jgi:predicted GNAT family N-acyltransferase